MTSLEERSQRFAEEVQTTLDSVLVGAREIVSLRGTDSPNRYIVQPRDRQRIPILVAGEHLADLLLSIYLDMDRTGTHLKAVRSDLKLYSTLDRSPLLRLEYRADMRTDPIAHWQMHAERGAFSHLLSRAHAQDPSRVEKPHDLSSVHLPVGGERFRPCLEDFLELLVVDCGVDALPHWRDALEAGRERWRRRQLGAAVRDIPAEAAQMLEELGWECRAPEQPPSENIGPLRKW